MSVALYEVIGFERSWAENVRHSLLDGTEHIQTMARRSRLEGFGIFIPKHQINTWLSEHIDLSTGAVAGYSGYYLDGEPAVEYAYPIKDYVNVSFTATKRESTT